MGEEIRGCGAWVVGVICSVSEGCIVGSSRWAGRNGVALEQIQKY